VLLATWNVNSIRARDARLRAWLLARRPDVLCLQELKCEEAKFPQDWLREAGYEAAATCQKGYNGVAILSRLPLSMLLIRPGLRVPGRRFFGEKIRQMALASRTIVLTFNRGWSFENDEAFEARRKRR